MRLIQCFLLIVFFIFSLKASSQDIKELSLEFNRSVYKDFKTDLQSGQIYFFDSTTIVKLQKPINQLLIYKKNSIVVYYPVENTTLIIKSASPSILPFFHSILGLVDDNINLEKLHYTIKKTEKKGDTLIILWQPPKEIKGAIGDYGISFIQNRISSIENFDKNGKVIIRTNYKEYKKIDNKYFPTQVKTVNYNKELISYEETYFFNILINKNIPVEIRNFKIPVDSKTKEIEW